MGHQAIIQQVIESAKARGVPSVAMTFEPQPHEFFIGERAPARLMRFREKVSALFEAGIDRVCCLQFNKSLRSLSAQAFVETVLVEGLGVQHLIVGDDFRFGCDRNGDYAFLQQQGEHFGFSVSDTPTFEMAGERVSSTRIRKVLDQADFRLAQELLGKPYAITGRVGYGKQLGRKLNAPTANVELHRFRSPLKGVFAVVATCYDTLQKTQQTHYGVANVGVRPTVDGDGKAILEVHLLNFQGDLYGKALKVEFKHKLRDEKRFESLEALQAQIAADIDAAQNYFSDTASEPVTQ
ncbi:riboflavin biosynthesis protein [Marinibactrum halimedae]|uniref:Riboflavin biosynthesis protein n=1 Tax=Marinibactrum halimedae TaxID=1444977 RepID=A0AA37TF98_9GAMM|nr:riboflavin biosynthesis protein [Marinibactrum halimedae]